MPRLKGYKERRHQSFWDHVVRSTGAPEGRLQSSVQLFNNRNLGSLALTNLQVAGQLASDQTAIVLAVRCFMHFAGENAKELYEGFASQLYFTFTVGDKPMLQTPAWMAPAGGGINGPESYSNGLVTNESILRLARPILLPVRQNFNVTAEFFPVGSSNIVNMVNENKATTMVCAYVIDTLQTRDIQ